LELGTEEAKEKAKKARRKYFAAIKKMKQQFPSAANSLSWTKGGESKARKALMCKLDKLQHLFPSE
jgi:hypothetical protein